MASGEQALPRLATRRYDLVLLDMSMPGMNGLDVCRRLREQDFAGGIVILTARDGELDRIRGFERKVLLGRSLLARAREHPRRRAEWTP